MEGTTAAFPLPPGYWRACESAVDVQAMAAPAAQRTARVFGEPRTADALLGSDVCATAAVAQLREAREALVAAYARVLRGEAAAVEAAGAAAASFSSALCDLRRIEALRLVRDELRLLSDPSSGS